MNNHTIPTFGTGLLHKVLVIAFAALGCLSASASLGLPVAADGDIDEVRIFTFAEGRFEESDLKGYVGVK